MTLGYRSFWRFGNTVVNSQIRRFNSPTESSPQTRTVYSFPLHFTINVSSSSVTDDDAIEPEAEAAIDCYCYFAKTSLSVSLNFTSFSLRPKPSCFVLFCGFVLCGEYSIKIHYALQES
jgi:hypothetical protein